MDTNVPTSSSSAGGGPVERADAIAVDAEQDQAPNPRRHYRSPEELCEDVALDLATREELLREWKQDVQRMLESESEGMSASDPISAERESRLAAEMRRVMDALSHVGAAREAAAANRG